MKLQITHRRVQNLKNVLEFLHNLPDGEYKISISANDDMLINVKKRYHAMVDELAKHAGYSSRKERDLFKDQVKAELGNESISEMTEVSQVSIKIEELHQLAVSHYSYFFKPYEK